MKTRTVSKMIIALLAVVILCSVSAAVYAETGKDTPAAEGSAEVQAEADKTEESAVAETGQAEAAETGSETTDPGCFSRGKNRPEGHKKAHKKSEQMEDWFEDRIEEREHKVDFSKLPEDPSEEEIIEFFKENFMGKADPDENRNSAGEKQQHRSGEKSHNGGKKHNGTSGKQKWHPDRFEDWFEDRIEALENDVDFSTLPENPTDEELLDFFRENFLGKGKKGPDFDKDGKAFPEHKSTPPQPALPDGEQEPGSETLPESDSAEENSDSPRETA